MADEQWTYSTQPAPQEAAPSVEPVGGEWTYSNQPSPSPGQTTTATSAYGQMKSDEEAMFSPDALRITPQRLPKPVEDEYYGFIAQNKKNQNFSQKDIDNFWTTRGYAPMQADDSFIETVRKGGDTGKIDYSPWDEAQQALENDRMKRAMDDFAKNEALEGDYASSVDEAVQYGFWGITSRTLKDWFDQNKDDLRKEYPNASDEELERLSDQDIIRRSRAARQHYAEANKDSGWVPWLAGQFTGSLDPTLLIAPGGSTAGRIAGSAGAQAGIQGVFEAIDAAQGLPSGQAGENILLAGALGGAFQGLVEVGGKIYRRVRGPQGEALEEVAQPTPEQIESAVPFNEREGLDNFLGRTEVPEAPVGPRPVSPEISERVQHITQDWKNAPEFEIVNSVDDIADPVVRGATDKDALGFVGEDGKVRIIADNLQGPNDLSAVIFHEALGHHGLSQKFGEGLDDLLTRMYDSGGKFKNDVDEFFDANPQYRDAYVDSDNPRARIVEEVLAKMSESGEALPPNIMAKFKHYLKELGRQMGLKLEFNDAEVMTILGMAHNATINGKPNAVSNGFRYSMEGMKFDKPEDIRIENPNWSANRKIDSRTRREDTLLRREAKVKNEKSYEDWQRDWEFDQFIDELEGNQKPIGTTEQFEDLSGRGREGPVVQTYTNDELMQRLAAGGPRYMKRQAGPGSEGMPTDMSRRAADEAETPYTGMGKVRSNRPDVPTILEEAAPTRDQESWNEWIDASKQVRKSAEKHAKDLKKGNAAEPADVIAARVGALNLANRISDISRKIGQGMGTEHDKYLLTQELIKLADLEDAIAGVVGNAARIANSMKIEVASDSATNRAIRYMAKNLGSLDDVDGIAARINQFEDNPEAIQQLAKDALKPLPEDYITSFRYTAMLSGLGTPVKAIVGTMSNMLFENIKDVGATVIGGLKRPFSDAERLTAREWGARNVGMMKSIVEATKAAGKSYKQGHAVNAPDRLEAGHASLPGSIVTEYPKRTLAAIDGFFREIIRGGEINGLAVRQALKEGLEPESPEWNARIDELVTNPTKEMEDIATKKADLQQLLDNDSRILRIMEAGTRRTDNMNTVDRAIRFGIQNIFPFTRNIDNIMRQTLRNSPIGFFSKNVQADLKAGGARRDQAISRIIVGSTLLYFAGEYAANGLATGQGNSNLDLEAMNAAAGRPANSVKIGDEWVSLEGFDAISAPFNAAASARVAWDRGDIDDKTYLERSLKALGAIASSLYDTTIIEQMDKFTGLFDKRNQNTELAVSLPASFVPAAVRQYTQWGEDRASLDTRGDKSFTDRTIGRTLSGLPEGLRTWIAEKLDFGEMPQKMDVFGRGVRRQGDPLAAATGIGRGTVEDMDPGVQEALRLSEKFGKALVTKTEDEITVDGEKIKLSPTERQQWQYLAGQLILEEINEAMKDPVWPTLNDEEKADEIKQIVKDSKADIKDEIFANYLEKEEEEGVDDGFIYE